MKGSIFDDLSAHELDEILKLMEEITLSPGTVIFRQDGPAEALYIIKEGTAELVKVNEFGESLSMGNAEKDMFLGELAILDGGKQPFTATVTDKIKCLMISSEKINLLSKINKKIHCKLFIALVRYVNYRLRKANEEYASSKSSLRNL